VELPHVQLVDLGRTRYAEALVYQRELQARRKAGEAPDTLVLTEHEPVFTLGRFADGNHLLVSEAMLAERGIELVRVERGGDITYHGPGQLVAYPILDLHRFGRDVHRYIRRLEETAIRLLATYAVEGERRPGTPGVWVGARKIASVGVHISRWVTMHGIAINVEPDLAPFELINPCGLVGMEMTSVARVTGRPAPLAQAQERYAAVFAEVFGCSLAGGHPGAPRPPYVGVDSASTGAGPLRSTSTP
jgi:lipoate-protein ligase B